MNGLIHNDLVISILVVALLTAVGRLLLGVYAVGLEGAAVFVAAGYVKVYLITLLWGRRRPPRRLGLPPTPEPPPSGERDVLEEFGGASTVQA